GALEQPAGGEVVERGLAATVVEGAELRHGPPADGDDDPVARLGPPHGCRQVGPQLPDVHVHMCTPAKLPPTRSARHDPAMNFAFSEEQEELRRIVRQFLDNKSSEAEVRRLMETTEGYDPATWSQMANELGLQSLVIPEEFGGQGFGYVELTVVLEEMGRALLPAPYFSTVVLAANTLLHSGDDAAKKELLPGIASGETIATLAFTEESGRWDEGGITIKATKSGDGYTLDGTKMFVLDGHTADLVLVAARNDGPDPQAGEARVLRHARHPHRHRRRRLVGARACARPRRRRARRRAGRRRAEGARDGGRVREGARAVRPAHRFVPGHQAQVRRHAARGRVGQVRGVLRGLVRVGAQRRAAVGGVAREGVLQRGVLPRCRREHPDPRWHRVHVGAPRPPVLQAGEVVRAAVRRSDVPPRAARAAHRHLSVLFLVAGAVLVVVIALVAVGREAFTLGA